MEIAWYVGAVAELAGAVVSPAPEDSVGFGGTSMGVGCADGIPVIACADLRCSDLYHLENHLNGLANDSDLLGTYLASLGVMGDEVSLY